MISNFNSMKQNELVVGPVQMFEVVCKGTIMIADSRLWTFLETFPLIL